MLRTILRRFSSTEQLTSLWLNRIKSLSSTSESMELYAQLSSLVEYFNKSIPQETKEIDWEYWNQNISTPNVVNNIKQTYEGALKEDYDITKAVAATTTKSKDITKLEWLVLYNSALWWQHYLQHIKQIECLNALGGLNYMSDVELNKYVPEMTTLYEADFTIGTGIVNSYVEFGVATGIMSQFSWRKGEVRPFMHNAFVIHQVGGSMGRFSKDR